MITAIDLAIIGGTGVYQLAALSGVEAHDVDTRYGKPSGPVRVGTLAGKQCKECGNYALIKKDGCEFCSACGAIGACG